MNKTIAIIVLVILGLFAVMGCTASHNGTNTNNPNPIASQGTPAQNTTNPVNVSACSLLSVSEAGAISGSKIISQVNSGSSCYYYEVANGKLFVDYPVLVINILQNLNDDTLTASWNNVQKNCTCPYCTCTTINGIGKEALWQKAMSNPLTLNVINQDKYITAVVYADSYKPVAEQAIKIILSK